MKKKALFLDRDGVLIEQVAYLKSPDQVKLEKGVVEGLRKIHAADWLAIMVTNQSGVARGLFTEEDVRAVNDRLQELLAEKGEKIDAFYVCCHHPDFGSDCDCRKPRPGLLLRAARDLGVDLAASVMAGDKLGDLLAGANAGCKKSVLVRTGYGKDEEKAAREAGFSDVCDDFRELADFALRA